MEFFNAVYILFFLVFLGLTIARIYNLMSMGGWYDIRIAFLTIFLVILLYAGSFSLLNYYSTGIVEYVDAAPYVLHAIMSFLLFFNVFFFVLELMLYFTTSFTKVKQNRGMRMYER